MNHLRVLRPPVRAFEEVRDPGTGGVARLARSGRGCRRASSSPSVSSESAPRSGSIAAFTHVALALVLYPLSGFAIARLSAKIFTTVQLHRQPLAAIGFVAGTMHALSVPLSVVFPDTEFTPVFAGSAILLAGWSLGTGLIGLGSPESAVELETTAEAPVFTRHTTA